ncbi:hypothetical protein IWW55_002651 [Coemansia sp. RSA 2706]|nr:hypothetical protein LPJ63_001664 [Coemansia sp. RSA 2711]KAJ2303977.1 hypothetical protein IWW55_002651 [Coemansia sp. RSA 2706]KAJ2308118.1 hypothetical protein IWW54_004168 [Coemansia sp. RSA 2705]KAJ2326281.1 hypothetical protein IWW51_002360 [Coemansia sp. RSA 2702]
MVDTDNGLVQSSFSTQAAHAARLLFQLTTTFPETSSYESTMFESIRHPERIPTLTPQVDPRQIDKPGDPPFPKLVTAAHLAMESTLLSPESQHSCSPYSTFEDFSNVQPDTQLVHALGQPIHSPAHEWSQAIDLFDISGSPAWPANLNNTGDFPIDGGELSVPLSACIQPYPECALPSSTGTRASLKRRRADEDPGDELLSSKIRKRKTLSDEQRRAFYTWLINNLNNPYPSESERTNELNIDKLTKQKFKWWFSNHRHRSWDQCEDESGNRVFKARLPFYKACLRLGVKIPWDTPPDIQEKLKQTRK